MKRLLKYRHPVNENNIPITNLNPIKKGGISI